MAPINKANSTKTSIGQVSLDSVIMSKNTIEEASISGGGNDAKQLAFNMEALRRKFVAIKRRFNKVADRMERYEKQNHYRAQP
ncbi:conserved hypothetical protein [Ricinus communis]|uniref:Uncharacterized protein n=1 Tax=Ricinus communis TaxID=3988 RepID=B9SL41_RICCO|nr:conserved hypothetical protein [Ricinus communis]